MWIKSTSGAATCTSQSMKISVSVLSKVVYFLSVTGQLANMQSKRCLGASRSSLHVPSSPLLALQRQQFRRVGGDRCWRRPDSLPARPASQMRSALSPRSHQGPNSHSPRTENSFSFSFQVFLLSHHYPYTHQQNVPSGRLSLALR